MKVQLYYVHGFTSDNSVFAYFDIYFLIYNSIKGVLAALYLPLNYSTFDHLDVVLDTLIYICF